MDWDQDGTLDILSGSYLTPGIQAGHLQFLRGSGGVEFDAAETMNDMEGNPVLNVAVTKSSDMQLKVKNFCTHQHAVDFDNDGDLDLVVGSNLDQFYFHENLAKSGAAPMISSNSVAMQVRLPSPAKHSAPHLADWDNDGDLDLISGSSVGGAFLSENVGSRSAPKYEPFQILIPLGDSSALSSTQRIDSASFEMGGSTRVWATDFNSDGWLDLLIGDCSSVMELKDGVTEEDLQAAAGISESEANKLVNNITTGFVWVYLRKPPQEL